MGLMLLPTGALSLIQPLLSLHPPSSCIHTWGTWEAKLHCIQATGEWFASPVQFILGQVREDLPTPLTKGIIFSFAALRKTQNKLRFQAVF